MTPDQTDVVVCKEIIRQIPVPLMMHHIYR